LLQQVGLTPTEVIPADIDETVGQTETPAGYARRMAVGKAKAVAEQNPDALVLAADTVVACGRRILPKADDLPTAEACLATLSGRRHQVVGGICLIGLRDRPVARTIRTTVRFKRLTPGEIAEYLGSGEWEGKAGGYAIQGVAAKFVAFLSGSYSNVVGLPLHETCQLLARES
jgi:septum formation protein